MNFQRISKKYVSPVQQMSQQKKLSIELKDNRKISRSQHLQAKLSPKLITAADNYGTSSIDKQQYSNLNHRQNVNPRNQFQVQDIGTLSGKDRVMRPTNTVDKQNRFKKMLQNDKSLENDEQLLKLVNDQNINSSRYDDRVQQVSQHINGQFQSSQFNNKNKPTSINSLHVQKRTNTKQPQISSSQDQITQSNPNKQVQVLTPYITKNIQQSNTETNDIKLSKMKSEPAELNIKTETTKFKRFISPFNTKLGSLPLITTSNTKPSLSEFSSAQDIEAELLKNTSLFNPNQVKRNSKRAPKITNLPEIINKWMGYYNDLSNHDNKSKSIKEYYSQYHILEDTEPQVENKGRYFSIFDEQAEEGHYIEKQNNSNLIQKIMEKNQIYCFLDWRFSKKGQNYNTYQQKLFNHFQYNHEIVNKGKLYQNIKHYCIQNSIDINNIMPPQFTIDFDKQNINKQIIALTQQVELCNDIKLFSNINRFFSDKFNLEFNVLRRSKEIVFIIKPTHLYANIGVHQVSSLKDLFNKMQQYYEGCLVSYYRKVVDSDGDQTVNKSNIVLSSKQFIVQQFITNYLTLNSLQFSLKYYVLVTTQLNVYMALDGLVYIKDSSRGAETIYSKDILVQILNEQDFISIQNKSIFIYVSVVLYQTQVLMSACKYLLKEPEMSNQFEIYQVEFIVDNKLNTYLIDVEGDLQFETSNQLLKQYIPDLLSIIYFYLDEALKISFAQIDDDGLSNQNMRFWQQII